MVWVKTQDLYNACNTIDKNSNKKRGIITVTKKEDNIKDKDNNERFINE